MNNKHFRAAVLMVLMILNGVSPVIPQIRAEVFEKVELLVPDGSRVDEKSVRLRFLENELVVEAVADGKTLKIFKYTEIKGAEYSYTKNPRWKTGLGLGAASIVFPPLLLVAIPIGFTKHRRHWLTVKTVGDYAVFKLSKRNRKLVVPAFETRTGVTVEGAGDNK